MSNDTQIAEMVFEEWIEMSLNSDYSKTVIFLRIPWIMEKSFLSIVYVQEKALA